MIFVTVGEQLPFDRLVSTVDEWAAVSGKEVIAQIGATHLKPQHIVYKDHFKIGEFKKIFLSAEIIIAHAGMGTILTALELKKPLIIMPRKAALGEHRNDHQFATIKKIIGFCNISIAINETVLLNNLNSIEYITKCAENVQLLDTSSSLIKTIKNFIS